jgi:asparagine synthase (glutamine-hydrolysing)
VSYWDLSFEPDPGVADWSEAIRGTLETAAAEMAVSDVPLGSFLSGGVDSSSVTAALSRSGFAVNTYTIGFQEEGYDERPWARTVAKLYGTRHTERVVEAADVEPVFERLLWHYDEPFGDYSYLPTFYLCREARKSITVALSGDGGDELFAGYLKYQRIGTREGLNGLIPASLGRLAAAAGERLLPDRSRLRRTLVQYGRDSTSMMTDMLTLGFPVRSLRRVARGPLVTAAAQYAPADVVTAHLRQAPPGEVGLVNAMRYLDLKLTLAGDMLVKVDRASMAVSLEVRPVFLHRDLLSLSARIPPSLLAGPNHSKGVLKAAVRPWLPDALLFRRKMGFAMPLPRWLDTVLGAKRPGPLDDLIDPRLIEHLQAAHARGQGDQTPLIHSLFFLDRWLRKWA